MIRSQIDIVIDLRVRVAWPLKDSSPLICWGFRFVPVKGLSAGRSRCKVMVTSLILVFPLSFTAVCWERVAYLHTNSSHRTACLGQRNGGGVKWKRETWRRVKRYRRILLVFRRIPNPLSTAIKETEEAEENQTLVCVSLFKFRW